MNCMGRGVEDVGLLVGVAGGVCVLVGVGLGVRVFAWTALGVINLVESTGKFVRVAPALGGNVALVFVFDIDGIKVGIPIDTSQNRVTIITAKPVKKSSGIALGRFCLRVKNDWEKFFKSSAIWVASLLT